MPYLFLEGFDTAPVTNNEDVARDYFEGKGYLRIAGDIYPSYTAGRVLPGRVRGGSSIKFPEYGLGYNSYIGSFVPPGANKAVIAFGWQFTGLMGAYRNLDSVAVIQFDNGSNTGVLIGLYADRLTLAIRTNSADGAATAVGNKVVRKDINLSGWNQIAVEVTKSTNTVRVFVNGILTVTTTFTPQAPYNLRAVGFGGGEAAWSNNTSNTNPTGSIGIQGSTLNQGGGHWLDDIYASYDEDYAGDLVVRSLLDASTVSNTGAVVGAADVKAAIATNDGDTSYVELGDNTEAFKEQYVGSFLPTDQIVDVSAVVTARRTDSELIDVGAEVDVGAGNVGLTYSPLNLSHNGNFFLWSTNPTTGVPFTPEQVNALALKVTRRNTP